MGCDIHAFLEVKLYDKWTFVEEVLDCRNYGLFGFLAGVRNYSHVPQIGATPGIPDDISIPLQDDIYENVGDCHSPHYIDVEKLLNFDYSQTFEDRRIGKQITPNFWSGSEDSGLGNGEIISYKEFLGEWYFDELDDIRKNSEGAEARIVFWFDN